MPVINPTTLTFQKSPDHEGTNFDGSPTVQGYRLETVGATPPTTDLGKPDPDAQGDITLDLPIVYTGGPYISQVSAYNVVGSSAGAASDTYGFIPPPRAPGGAGVA